MIRTFQYRIKDASSRKMLLKLASSINYVWNYINDLSYRFLKQNNKFLSNYDIDKYLAGAAEELNLNSTSLQEVSKYYVNNRKTFKKQKLAWRSAKRNTLGWVPFKVAAIKFINDDAIRYNKYIFRFYKSKSIPANAKIKTGSFNQDSRGRWYLNITFETDVDASHQHPNSKVGVDLGVKNQIALSNGKTFKRENVSKKYEDKLATAQRANKKKLIKNIYAKISNIRKDWSHKTTTQIAKQFETIYVGDLSPTDILTENNKVNRSIYDAAIYQIKSFLQYKTVKFGGNCNLINESYSTQICNNCKQLNGPKGQEELDIREWVCSCGANHQRDVNSAKNILDFGEALLLQNVATDNIAVAEENCNTNRTLFASI